MGTSGSRSWRLWRGRMRRTDNGSIEDEEIGGDGEIVNTCLLRLLRARKGALALSGYSVAFERHSEAEFDLCEQQCVALYSVVFVHQTYGPRRTPCNTRVSAQKTHCQFNTSILLVMSPRTEEENDDLHSKSPRTDRHGPHQRRSNTLPKSSRTF